MSQAFIGCKISLISKSEIRYEGILYTIDTKESTIALSKVRSFGTEDRKTDKPVAPRNEVYEYIIFRASDIKDLIVDDPPAVTSTGLSDPAIIQAQSVGSSTQVSTTYTVLPGTSISTTTSAGATKQPTLANVLNAGNQSKGADTAARGGSRGASPNAQRKSPANEQNKHQERRNNQPRSDAPRSDGRNVFNNRGGRDGGRREVQQQNSQSQQQRQLPQQPHQQQQQRPYQNRQFPNQQQQQQYGHQNREYQNRDQQNREYSGQRGGGRGGYRDALQNAPRQGQGGYRTNQNQQQGGYNRPRPQSFNQNRPPRTDVTKLEEYDFEKANQEFTELESKFEKLDVAPESKPDEPDSADTSKLNPEDDEAFYDKKKSFFDSISCEALERSKGNVQRIDRTQERKLNQETFGVAGIRGRGGYRRGYGRGGYHNNRNNYQRGGYNNRRGGDSNRSLNNNRNDGESHQQETRQPQAASQNW